jgi:two-component system, cell cycle sensor histidine kinase and response regulator CckA
MLKSIGQGDTQPEAVIVTTLEHRVLAWGQGAEGLYGILGSEAVGRLVDELITVDGGLWTEHGGQREVVQRGSWQGTVRHATRSGRESAVRWSLSRVSLPDTAAPFIVAVAASLGARVSTGQLLQASEQKTRSILRAAPIGIGMVVGRVLREVNEELCRMTGYSSDELLGNSARMLYPSDEDYEYVGREKYRQIAERGTGTVETHWRKKSGEIIDVLLSSTPLDPADQAHGVTFTALDITARLRNVAELRESEAKFRSIIESSPLGMHLYALEEDGRLVFEGANPAADRILGVANAQFIGLTIEQAFPPLAHTEIPERYRAVASGAGLWSTSQVDYQDGRIAGAYEVHAFQTSPNRMVVMFQDVTARLRAEAALREKTAELDRFFSSALDLLCIADTSGTFRRLNPEWERTLGYALDELVGQEFLDFVHPDDIAPTRQRLAELAEQKPVANFRNRYRHKDGSYRWIEWRAYPVGELIYAAARDVTDRMTEQAALLESERLNRMIAEMASDYVFHLRVDPEGRAVMDYVSRSFREITGRTLEQVADVEQWADFTHPEDIPKVWAELARVIGEKQPVEVECRWFVRGELRWTHIYARPELDPEGQRVVGIIGASKDITDQKRMEAEQAKLREQLQQAMKMEAIGRLAGGLAHDFNNLLTGIIGNADLALMDLDPSSPVVALLHEVIKAGRSAATLTQQLLAFSRKQMTEPRVINLNDLVGNLQNMLARLIGEDIDLRVVVGQDLASVKLDPARFEQVIVHLAVNARDAMPDGGAMVLETANVELSQDYCETHPGAVAGRYVMLAVSDTGTGMSQQVLDHLFEPFFTTKPKGKGTGLGLATIYGTVKQAGGSIEVYSELGKGSTFKVYLPAVSERPAKWSPALKSPELPTGHEVVLLVEDEDTVRGLAERVLGRLGYTVLCAHSGAEALEIAERRAEGIDLLLTDVVMPGMSGRDLAHRLRPTHPEAKVLYASGYTENVIVHHGVVDEGISFIGKPYSTRDLARKVREVLDGTAQGKSPQD